LFSSFVESQELKIEKQRKMTRIFSAVKGIVLILAPSFVYTLTVSDAKAKVISIAKECRESGGVFVSNDNKRKELQKAVAELEAICGSPTIESKDSMLGDWTLISTTNVSPLPPLPLAFLPRNPVQEELRKVVYSNVEVIQKIRNDMTPVETGNEEINRVDNVIQFSTPEEGTLSKFPNPLALTRAKVTLCHNANIESMSPLLRTKISLKSVIITVAGKSQYLEPEGADVLGINVPPIQDILNAGVFDTTYADSVLRISRGPAVSGFLDEQLRVFLRASSNREDEIESMESVEELEELSSVSQEVEAEEEEVVDTEEELDSGVNGNKEGVKEQDISSNEDEDDADDVSKPETESE